MEKAMTERQEVELQEEELQFDSFSSDDALEIGLGLMDLATEKKVSIEIDIEVEGHCLFHFAMEGTSIGNSDWIRRKKNTMKQAGKSSLLVFLELEESGRSFEQVYGQKEDDFAVCGGGFPIRLKEKGIVGSIVVSGLPHKEDHALIIEILTLYLDPGSTME